MTLTMAAVVTVFVAAFRFGLRDVTRCRSEAGERDTGLPRAVIAAGDARWLAGQGRQRWLGRLPTLQAVLVATGVTAAFVMALCLLAIAALAIASL